MAPSASMLFLSYHQLHQPAAEAPPRKEEAGGSGFRLSLSSVLSLPMFERRRREAPAPAVRDERSTVRERDAGESAAAVNKELEEKFEEAVRLSCWSS
ncbi:unnamed protein product [Urochloa decumbens]|uniref:Uncharacterized protein n=1 Tax=Urochloa decumbens TaxID=240449 RepID=A0ABC8YKI6_9POAL